MEEKYVDCDSKNNLHLLSLADDLGRTPLLCAAASGNSEILEGLEKKLTQDEFRELLSITDQRLQTPLMLAAAS